MESIATTKPQTSHVLQFQSGQDSQGSVLTVELLGGDNQLEGHSPWTWTIRSG
jgi:hypothetical protein